VRDLLKSVLIVSDNNAAVALARSTGLSLEEFVFRMNEKAQDLGMMATIFIEPTGLSSSNISTVNDVAKLVRVAFTNPVISEIAGTPSSSYWIINTGRLNELTSTNQLFGTFIKVIAGKTGYSDEAGGCLRFWLKETPAKSFDNYFRISRSL
jgi:D-alanyl-D-alanine endopeptidase (penicillin-binding protein 7)